MTAPDSPERRHGEISALLELKRQSTRSRLPAISGRIRSTLAYAVAWVLVASVAHAQAPIAAAFCKAATKWPENVYRMHVQDYVPEGWEATIDNSAQQWNWTSQLQYQPTFESTDWWNFNFDNQDFEYYDYPPFPGLTERLQRGNGFHNRADVHLNNNYSWNFAGTMNFAQRKADVRTVSVHEIGHATGLNHPDPAEGYCPAPFTADEQASAMHPNWVKKWTTRIDDDNGNRALYP